MKQEKTLLMAKSTQSKSLKRQNTQGSGPQLQSDEIITKKFKAIIQSKAKLILSDKDREFVYDVVRFLNFDKALTPPAHLV